MLLLVAACVGLQRPPAARRARVGPPAGRGGCRPESGSSSSACSACRPGSCAAYQSYRARLRCPASPQGRSAVRGAERQPLRRVAAWRTAAGWGRPVRPQRYPRRRAALQVPSLRSQGGRVQLEKTPTWRRWRRCRGAAVRSAGRRGGSPGSGRGGVRDSVAGAGYTACVGRGRGRRRGEGWEVGALCTMPLGILLVTWSSCCSGAHGATGLRRLRCGCHCGRSRLLVSFSGCAATRAVILHLPFSDGFTSMSHCSLPVLRRSSPVLALRLTRRRCLVLVGRTISINIFQ